MQRHWLGVLVGLMVGSGAGCLLEVEARIACGDGYHDPRHEDCDPADPASFQLACDEDEVPTCDVQTCELSCGSCGDGRLDEGEACDGNSVRTIPPCQDWSCVACQVVCPRCGNGQIDSGEECDVGFDAVASEPTRCSAITVPGRPDKDYSSESPVSCLLGCTWDRTGCNLCGDGVQDDALIDPTKGTILAAAEVCDQDDFDVEARFDRCKSECGTGTDCAALCGEGCLNIDVAPDPACCARPGFASNGFPCCCELPAYEDSLYCTGTFDPPIVGEGVCPG